MDTQAHGALMPGIPGQFERDLAEISQTHATIMTKIQIIKYANQRRRRDRRATALRGQLRIACGTSLAGEFLKEYCGNHSRGG